MAQRQAKTDWTAFEKKVKKTRRKLESSQEKRRRKQGKETRYQKNLRLREEARKKSDLAIQERAAKRKAQLPAPTPTPELPKKEGLLEKISPTKKIISAITGKRDGVKLTPLERVQQVTGAIRNVALAAVGIYAAGAGISALTGGKAAGAAGIKAYATQKGVIYATSTKAAQLGIKGATGAAKNIAMNTKTVQLAGSIATKVFGKKTAVIGLTAIVGMETTSLVLGLWAGAEAPEPILFLGDDIMSRAEKTGDPVDWELYDKWKGMITEYTSTSTIDRIIDLSPVGFLRNIIKKGDLIGKGAAMRIELGDNIRVAQETGKDLYQIEREKTTAEEATRVDYFNQEAINTKEKTLELTKKAQAARDKVEKKIFLEELALWKKHKEDMIELEKKEREASAQFWLEYAKLKMQLREANSPSNLNFGLL